MKGNAPILWLGFIFTSDFKEGKETFQIRIPIALMCPIFREIPFSLLFFSLLIYVLSHKRKSYRVQENMYFNKNSIECSCRAFNVHLVHYNITTSSEKIWLTFQSIGLKSLSTTLVVLLHFFYPLYSNDYLFAAVVRVHF